MLDTIVLTLPEHHFCIQHPERFNPPAGNLRGSFAGQREVLKFVYNPNKAEKMSGYKPRLTLYRRPVASAESITLKIEFSAPKLLFGNNFEEISGGDLLPQLLDKLFAALVAMGIETRREYLEHAKVSKIDYSKNILLDRTTPCFLIIQALEKLDLNIKLDLTQTDFRNGGQMAKYHATTYEIAMYDKVKDLEQAAKYGEKRGAEKDYEGQLNLFSQRKEKPEVLRFEVRLTGRKLTSLLTTLRITAAKTLAGLFSLDISRAILLHYWQIITEGLFVMNINVQDAEKLICNIRTQFPRMRPARMLSLMAYVTTCQTMGMRPARQALRLNNTAWARLKKDAKALEKQKLNPRFQVLNAIKSELLEFYPAHPAGHRCGRIVVAMPTLDFKGKQFVYAHHLTVPFRQLQVDDKKSLPAKGQKPDLDGSLIINGDNLHALKALLPKYAGKIKCIYIDPPYNTGNEGWCYNDKVNAPLIREWLKKEVNPVDKEDLERHDKWLSMMWPRLQLLRELLADDGVIFVSIDDIEYSFLIGILNEIFEEHNHLATLIWKSRQIVDSRSLNGISTDHEYIAVFGKNLSTSFLGKESDESKYSNPDNDTRGAWMSNSILGLANKEQRPNLHYDITDPKTGISFSCPPDSGWRYSRETMGAKIADGRIIFPKTKDGRPREKKFMDELAKKFTGFSSILNTDVGFTLNGTRELRDILVENDFAFPKPHSLIKTLIRQVTDKNDIILDSFAGSGTTAHAVLALNKEDGGNRKFILVEMEDYADKVTAERVRRVIKGVPGVKDDNLKAGLGGNFTYCTLGDEINIENLLKGEKLPSYEDLARYAFYTATGQTLDKVKQDVDYLVGETTNYRVHVIYKPDLEFLRSKDSALNMALAERIGKSRGKSGKTALVFAPHKFMGQKELKDMGITFCQLPYAIHRIAGD